MDTPTKIKTVLSMILLISCIVFTIFATSNINSAQGTNCLILDFGDDETYFINLGDQEDPDAYDSLNSLCLMYELDLKWDGNEVSEIDGVISGEEKSWKLYVIDKPGENQTAFEWRLSDNSPSDTKIKEYASVAWAYGDAENVPSNAVDATGVSFYGYGHPQRIVSLAPSCTETICSVGGEKKLVGTDRYSNYPLSVKSARDEGRIVDTGGFTNPSFESIVKAKPDLVIGTDAQFAHKDVAKKLRSVGTNVLIVPEGGDVDSILESIMMTGTAMGVREEAKVVADGVKEDIENIRTIIMNNSSAPKSVVVSLSLEKSPWVSSSGTYVSDILDKICVTNGFSYMSQSGWIMVNSEFLMPEYTKIDYLIVVMADGPTNLDEYKKILENLPDEWKKTNAYNEDPLKSRIYFLTGEAGDLASRPGPRVAQLTELIGKMVQQSAFDSEAIRFAGDDYRDHISITTDPVIR